MSAWRGRRALIVLLLVLLLAASLALNGYLFRLARMYYLQLNETRLDPVGVPFTPPVAGDYTTESGVALAAALLSPASTESHAWPGDADPAADADGGAFDPVTWLLLLAGVLLAVEWFLVRTGRMP